MKNLSASLLFVLLALAGQLSAQTIRRVNNNGITGTNIYVDLTAAQTAASNGDIIQVEPSTTVYPAFTCTKQLTIVGPGYFLAENQPPALQASVIPATISSINFNPGSAGTNVSGLSSNTTWYINANNITVQRCYLTGYIYLAFGSNTSGAVLRQNYFYGVQESSVSTNSLITNNIMFAGGTTINAVGATGEFANNSCLGSPVSLNNFTVRNNYFNSTFTPTANTNWAYNFFTSSTLPTLGTASNNTANVPAASVFTQTTGAGQHDAWYKLKTGTNPAVGAGQGGIDIGATGSATGYGYKFGGQPAIPAIYQLNQSVTGNNLNVTLGTRSNN
ncbi:hypothetical protein [Hymenobacter antarcticus]|uniref:Right handed beta helix region n=1 Tax=Hymenobacter antarcticus TaxID=486270 RepID=A0ABP7PYQ9_9BACT